jgi:predicted amidohydrolase YtcJ
MTAVAAGRIHGWSGQGRLIVEGGVIAAVEVADTPTTSRPNKTILPGLRDAHIHPIGLAAWGHMVDLSRARSLQEVGDVLATRAMQLGDDGPVVAIGLDEERLDEGRMPTRWDLDFMMPDRPVLVYRHCSHVGVASSVALRMAGVDGATPDPMGGRFQRNERGEPTGILEEAALTVVSAPLEGRTAGPDVETVLAILHGLRRRGIVAIDAMVSAGPSMWCAGGDELSLVAALGHRSPVAVDVYVITDTPQGLQDAARFLDQAGPMVRFAGWKGFTDGSLGGRTAALRRPYADDPTTSGLDRYVAAHFETMTAAALERGGTAAIHAIGDLAVERALTVAERLGPGTVRIEHASITDQEQIGRMAAAGVVASVQPSFVPSDAPWLGRRLGTERALWAYPFRSMLDAGVVLRGGSDAPIESPDPFVGIRDAVAPRPQAVTFEEAVGMYASSTLAVGQPATFVVVEGEPGRASVDAISETSVAEVWIDGERAV